MARKPNYNFERRERERVKAAKKTARLEAKRERTDKRKAEAAGLPYPSEEANGEATDGEATDGEATNAEETNGENTDGPEIDPVGTGPMVQPENNQ
jgi:hypothetical protein